MTDANVLNLGHHPRKQQRNVQQSTVSRHVNELLSFKEIEEWRKDNTGVLTGYRPPTSDWRVCFKSVGQWHNETVNIWTHLAGALCATTVALLLAFSEFYHPGTEFHTILALLPLFGHFGSADWKDVLIVSCFLLGCLVCFTCSVVFHASLCHREEVVLLTGRLDFIGILTLGTLNFFPTFYYGFHCDPVLRTVYMCLMLASGSIGIGLVCAPTYHTPAYRRMRAVTFVSLGLVAVLPFAHALVKYGAHEASKAMSLPWIAAEIVAYLMGVLLYAERCPECVFPGQFDLLGSSHQLFHVCSLLAVGFHYKATAEAFRYFHSVHRGMCV